MKNCCFSSTFCSNSTFRSAWKLLNVHDSFDSKIAISQLQFFFYCAISSSFLKRGAQMSGSNPDPGDVFRSCCVRTSNSPWWSCFFALSPRSTVCSFTPFSSTLLSLPFACPYRALLWLVPSLLCSRCFFPAFLRVIFTSVWSTHRIHVISQTCRITGRSAVALRMHDAGKRDSRCCVRVASYSTVDEIRRSTGYHRINLQLETRKKRWGIDCIIPD